MNASTTTICCRRSVLADPFEQISDGLLLHLIEVVRDNEFTPQHSEPRANGTVVGRVLLLVVLLFHQLRAANAVLPFLRDPAACLVPVILTALLLLAIGYLLGSTPSGYMAGRWLKGIDLRDCGSGSTGATNVLRNVGKGPALVVFLIDVGKGALAVLLAKTFGLSDWWQVLAGLAALAGHIWPVWLGWKGGKAVATGFGMFLGLAWPVGLACFGLFMAVISIFRIVSLSSVVAALGLPLLMLAAGQSSAYVVVSLVASLMVLWRHRSNIQRLIAGTEPRIGQKS